MTATDTTHPQVVTVTVNPAVDQTVWIPGFRPGEVNRVVAETTRPGGKGVNVAARLGSLGVSTVATGVLGRDNATLFEQFLSERDVAERFVRRPGATRTSVKIVDASAAQTTDINFPGETPDAAALDELLERVAELAGGARWVVLAGSLPPGVPTSLYRRLCDAAHDAGARVAVDSSGAAMAEAILARPELVKPNAEELAELVGRQLGDDDAVLDAANELLARGVGQVVVSLGGRGALFVTAERAVRAEPLRVEVISTVGAGDAMVAGAVAGALAELTLEQTAALATASSAAAISSAPTTGTAADASTSLVHELAAQVRTEALRTRSDAPQRGTT